jgi:hypothetical protein
MVRALGEYQELLAKYNRDFDEVFARRSRGAEEEADEVIERLQGAQKLLLKYPVAGQALFGALVREGRRFAKTSRGAEWMARLASSPTLRTARTLFEGISGGMVAEGGGPLPSVFVEAFVHALDRNLEDVLADVAGVKAEK